MRLVTGDTLRDSAERPRWPGHGDGQGTAPVDVALQVSRLQSAWRAEREVLVALARRAERYPCCRMTIVFNIEREGIP